MRSLSPLLRLSGGLLGTVATLAAAQPSTLLLVDDGAVYYRAGTRRVLHPAAKHAGNPVLRADKPWESAEAFAVSLHLAK